MAIADYEIRETKPKAPGEKVEFYFVLQAANGEVLATSETYTRREDAARGIEAHKIASEGATDDPDSGEMD